MAFCVGAALFAGGYLALGFIPLVRSADLAVGLKTVLTAFITANPALSKVAAIAMMESRDSNSSKHTFSRLFTDFVPLNKWAGPNIE